MGNLQVLPVSREIDGRVLDGGGYISVSINLGTKALTAELIYGDRAHEWLVEADSEGRYPVKDIIDHPNYYLGTRLGRFIGDIYEDE